MKLFYSLFFLLVTLTSFSQNGLVRGHVYNAANNEAVALGKITIIELQKGAITKEDGSFEIVTTKNKLSCSQQLRIIS